MTTALLAVSAIWAVFMGVIAGALMMAGGDQYRGRACWVAALGVGLAVLLAVR